MFHFSLMPRLTKADKTTNEKGPLDYTFPPHPGSYSTPKRACLKQTSPHESPLFLDDLKGIVVAKKKASLKKINLNRSLHHKSLSLPSYFFAPKNSTSLETISSEYSNSSSPPRSLMKKSAKKSVSFTNVEVLQFERQPGCNPSVSSGVPIALGWKLVGGNILQIDDYELTQTRRTKNELRLSPNERQRLLKDIWGYSFKEILGATMESRETRTKRMQTASRDQLHHNLISFSKLEEIKESSGRKLNRLFFRANKDFNHLIVQAEARQHYLEMHPLPAHSVSRRPSLIQEEHLLDDQKLSLCRRRSSLSDSLSCSWHGRHSNAILPMMED